MNSPAPPPIIDFLSRSATGGASAGQMGEMIVSAWQQVDAALAPVIGQRGVTALYQRSLHLAGGTHASLRSLQAGGLDAMNLDALGAALAHLDSAQAAAAGGALLVAFHGLVGSLIGAALSGQLLRGVWTQFFGGSPAQDPPS